MLDELEIRELRGLADQLSERERVVLRAHYGLGEPVRTLNQIGAELGLTAERARQIEVGALTKLREALAQPSRPEARPAGNRGSAGLLPRQRQPRRLSGDIEESRRVPRPRRPCASASLWS